MICRCYKVKNMTFCGISECLFWLSSSLLVGRSVSLTILVDRKPSACYLVQSHRQRQPFLPLVTAGSLPAIVAQQTGQLCGTRGTPVRSDPAWLIDECSAFEASFKPRFIPSQRFLFQRLAGAIDPCRPLEFLVHKRGFYVNRPWERAPQLQLTQKGGGASCT